MNYELNEDKYIGKIFKNYEGLYFKVLEFSHLDNRNRKYYKIRFDINNLIVSVRVDTIRSGKISSRTKYDLTNKKFGRLTALDKYTDKGKVYWRCKCDCGNESIVEYYNLKSGHTKSCGCYMVDKTKESNITHNMSKTRFYTIYNNMKSRCYNPNNNRYYNYGELGIEVCDRWKESFENFKNDMYEEYLKHCEIFGEEKTTLDRIDIHKGYEPNNCRWADYYIQNSNKSNCNVYGVVGVTKDLERDKWVSQISFEGSHIHLGRYKYKKDAIKARLEAELGFFGVDLAPQSYLFEEYNIKE